MPGNSQQTEWSNASEPIICPVAMSAITVAAPSRSIALGSSTMVAITSARELRNRSSQFVMRIVGDGSLLGDDDSDDCFGKPDHQLFQLTVLAFETFQRLFQLCVPVNFIETVRPSLLGSNLLHCHPSA